MNESLHSSSLYLLIVALAVYGWRWRQVAIREILARQVIDARLDCINRSLRQNYEQALVRRRSYQEQEDSENEQRHGHHG